MFCPGLASHLRFTGDTAAAAEAFATAVSYSQTMVQYSWVSNGSSSHFTLGYANSGADGLPETWPMIYNALWSDKATGNGQIKK